ncbi:hypothetical protein N7474_002119 [Penicillium riverlandense]|uniref:uncharacterized protein n=1 Tax=Penicillium riverlandense TaxID=1903569 RepID=UPI00254745C9|nr:uncharacterized protein N7474_002119 [Penicillium riverlandense]KAJ5833808.1 hypothetical protein N7474_002119 [Penicillium riverlandense]
MPLDEEGAKWSCEPCIRGHRSSKCQHFDRLMMKVPKAGRPLAKCPHPKGTCSCQKTYAVMVRIPKGKAFQSLKVVEVSLTPAGSGCLCRPLYNVPLDANGEPQSTPSTMAPIASPTPGKIQKSGRRQSSLQAAPENIAKAFDAMPGPVNLKFENDATNQLFNFASQSDLDSAHTSTNHDISDQASSDATQIANGAPQPTQQGSACCSRKSQTPAPAPNGSCCGKSATSSADDFALSGLPEHNNVQHSSWDNMSYEHFSAPQMSSWQTSPRGQFMEFGMNEAQPQPTSYMNGHKQNMSTPQSMMYPDQLSGLGISQTAFPMQPQNASNKTVGGESCTECNCGDDCQCLGCSVHPFNNTTRQHVQEMGVIMTFDSGDQTPDGVASAYQSSQFPGGTTPLNLSFMQHTPSMDPSAQQDYAFEPYSDPSSNLSTGYSSPLPANYPFSQQLMHPSEYYTLEYPVGLPGACSDITGSCQCGSDCSCVGCLTHSGHNGVPLESPVPDRSVAGTSEQHPSCHSAPASPSQHQTSRIPVLDSNISVPCLSPRTLETSMI